MAIFKPILMPPQKTLLLSESLNDPEWCFQISRIKSFRKSQEMLGVSKQTLEFLTVASSQGTLSVYKCCWENTGLADMTDNTLIAFVPL